MKARKTARRRGFTFLEIMFVVVIIGVLLAVAVPKMTGKSRQAQIRATELGIRNVGLALKEYELATGQFPNTSEGLMALVERPSNIDEDRWTGPYLDDEEMPKDAWGHEFNYRSPGDHKKDYDLWSSGPDGIEGNEDDVKNWKEK